MRGETGSATSGQPSTILCDLNHALSERLASVLSSLRSLVGAGGSGAGPQQVLPEQSLPSRRLAAFGMTLSGCRTTTTTKWCDDAWTAN